MTVLFECVYPRVQISRLMKIYLLGLVALLTGCTTINDPPKSSPNYAAFKEAQAASAAMPKYSTKEWNEMIDAKVAKEEAQATAKIKAWRIAEAAHGPNYIAIHPNTQFREAILAHRLEIGMSPGEVDAALPWPDFGFDEQSIFEEDTTTSASGTITWYSSPSPNRLLLMFKNGKLAAWNKRG